MVGCIWPTGCRLEFYELRFIDVYIQYVILHFIFRWILDIFKLGYKRDLKIEDLYDALDEHRSDFLGDKLEKYVFFVL